MAAVRFSPHPRRSRRHPRRGIRRSSRRPSSRHPRAADRPRGEALAGDPVSRPSAPACDDSALVGVESGLELVGSFQSSAYRRQIPLNTALELTLACNIRCRHCYNFDRDQPREPACGAEKPELTLAETLSLLGELRDAGCLFLVLTGGEVLSSPKLFPVLDRARELNLAVQLLTNGTLPRPGVAAKLAGYPNLMGASVSLYGATPQTHDGITQVR